jgi:hypothetical protein
LLITNPDLPECIANDWPLADSPPFEAWWTSTGAKGYTDWPMYDPTQAEKPKENISNENVVTSLAELYCVQSKK